MERLASMGELGQTDLQRVYAGAYLTFYTYVERSIERLFLGLLMNRLIMVDVKPLVDIHSDRVARAVISSDRAYVDWLPFDRYTTRRANAFLSRGEPFAAVSKADRRTLDQLGVIRNAIAHDSSHALRQFRRTFTDGKALPPAQRRPAGYLRGQHSLGVTRLSNQFAETLAVFQRLCQ